MENIRDQEIPNDGFNLTQSVLMAFAGLGYLMLLWPPLVNYVAPFNLVLAAPGELSLVMWLLVVGVNVERWKEQAAR